MTITPVELHHIRLKRGLLGYRRGPVDHLIDEIAESFEDVWRERADHADRVEHLEGELVRYRELEALLRTTLVSAERAAHELEGPGASERPSCRHARPMPRHGAVTAGGRGGARTLLAEARTVRALLEPRSTPSTTTDAERAGRTRARDAA